MRKLFPLLVLLFAALNCVQGQTAGPFSIQLRPEFNFSWTIADGLIHANMASNTSSWLGFGLSPTSFLTFHGTI